MRKEKISGWGRNSLFEANILEYNGLDVQKNFKYLPITARGLGRSYGDSSLGKNIIQSNKLNHLVSFDCKNGVLESESGVCLDEIIKIFTPKGWFPPVTPGTRFVTIGGMLASDVHGKNHHRVGSFSNHVSGFSLLTADQSIRWITKETEPELFFATAGGMGLTGLILSVRFQMIPIQTSWIKQQIYKISNLDELLSQFDATNRSTYSVAWVDCLAKGKNIGRSLLMLGEHAKYEELNPLQIKKNKFQQTRELCIPFNFPTFVMNKWSVSAFNALYYNRIRNDHNTSIIQLVNFFYPLDVVQDWNRIYGNRGFYQYQCVLPKLPDGALALKEILTKIADAGSGSFLAVLKLFGKEDPPYLAFATEGYTLALDFPYDKGNTHLFEILDKVVKTAGGRLYLTKDARMSRKFFQESYPKLSLFMKIKKQIDPYNYFTSLQAQRLGIIS